MLCLKPRKSGMSSKSDSKPAEGDLVQVWDNREGVVVGSYGIGYYEVLFKTPSGTTVRAVRDQDIKLIQKLDNR
jgi:hypothetical protein